MLIDWFTVIAQVVNFLILVWLLKRFLYKPILNAIDTREKKVADELANAATKEAEAQKEKEEFRRKNEEFDQQCAALLSKAKDEANAERQQLLEEARKDASDLRAKQQAAMRNDKQNLNKEISRRTQQEVFAIARKTLKDLAGVSLEERAVDIFVQKLHELNGKEKEQLASALSTSQNPVLVRSAFDLSQEQHDMIKKTIKETLGIEIQARFETAPDLVSGIELTTDGEKVAWSISNYLTSLEKSIDEVLKKQSSSEAEKEAESESDKSKPEKDSETKQKPGTEQEPQTRSESETKNEPRSGRETETQQKSDTKPEPITEQEINPEPKPT